MKVLEVKNIGINFGGLRAVDNFSLNINQGELYGLIGPNGAGKTTIFNLLTGVYAASDGEILLNGESIKHLKTYQINRKGVARTFQNIRLFKNMTVLENVMVALEMQYHSPFLTTILKSKKNLKNEKDMEAEALDLLKVFHLENEASLLAQNLSYGKQRELEIARALASHPKLLLLDEPAAGMNPQETLDLMENIKKVQKRFDVAILLIEHDMKFVKGICNEVTVLNYGRILAKGKTADVLNDKEVIRAYLGD